ncbi:OTU domain-containing protein 7B-like isoform X1 [Planococcus citri]|uniref:OTU domain-containing protein 7B-like isoform X1 n=1 Tax=Planococcus citri TaxID=170843 RepID=UPI0031F92B77
MVNEIVELADSVDDRCNSTSENKENYRSEYKTLNRGISRATDNVNIVSRVRSELALVDNTDEEYLSIDTPVYTFTLPDFTQFPDDFREFLEKDLISISTQSSLEQANRLNWWTSFAQRLWPLSTSGDGNCLLHAASLGVWGFHDRLLTLRKNLHTFLSQSTYREALWRRWKRQQSILNAQAGLVYSEVEWRREWNAIVSMASTTPRLRRQSIVSAGKGDLYGNIYESLEEIHVLALAHLLKRPIIVVADTMLKDMNGEPLAPIPFGGVYLPVECTPSECQRSPLLLAYDGGHFSALVAMDSSNNPNNPNTPAIPLVDSSNELLCIQFHTDPGDNEEEDFTELSFNDSISLLNEYLDVVRLDPQGNNSENNKNGLLGSLGRSVGNKLRLKLTRSNSVRNNTTNKSGHILCALLHTDRRHEYHDVMIKNYLQNAMERFQQTNAGAPRYGAGKSQFYTEADAESHEKVSQLTPVKPATNNDPTLYLSKSTFYKTGVQCRAENCTFFGNDQYDNYCSQCYQSKKKTI